ncbi:hypothetical protein [Nocardia niwae]|uniref:hypothetical protein n=1 Tax=Nocardia niwae TaxID=626084 RepID=UPI0007A545C3|nr:hypothetical protein [Nocardia niwae]
MDKQDLARLIDPHAWAALEADQKTLGGQWDLKMRRYDSEEAAQRIIDGGFALVKLPDMVVDGAGQHTWPVVSRDDFARVVHRRSDGRLALDSVSNPFANPEHALSLAAALIAAARHVQQEGVSS